MELNEEERKQSERLFNLRRRIYDHCNQKDWSDNYPDTETLMDFDTDIDGVEIRYKGLSDQDIFALVVIVQDLRDYGTQKRHFSFMDWKPNYIAKLAKQEPAIRCSTLYNYEEGNIAGKGYIISGIVRNEMNRLYEDFLWKELPIVDHPQYRILVKVDAPGIFTGVTTLHSTKADHAEEIEICNPNSMYYKLLNWAKDERGKLKDVISVPISCVKAWRIS